MDSGPPFLLDSVKLMLFPRFSAHSRCLQTLALWCLTRKLGWIRHQRLADLSIHGLRTQFAHGSSAEWRKDA